MNRDCTVFQTVDFISRKWALIILLELYKGKTKKRYSEIKEKIPNITPKLLSARLKELVDEGVISKKVDSKSVPIKCEYTLTKSGKDFIRIIQDIKDWSLKWKIDNDICRNTQCKVCKF